MKMYDVDENFSCIFVNKRNNILDKKDNTILYVGDRRRYKNFERLLKAFGNSLFLKKNLN